MRAAADPRLSAAIAAGKLTAAAVRRLGRGGGTTLPGRVSAALDGATLRKLCERLPQGTVMVTGTNGKTTTATLIRHLCESAGTPVAGNRAGANLMSGLTSAMVRYSGLGGSPHAELGIFEVDEAVLPYAVEAAVPRLVVVTNLFRDQLDRYGELESSAAAIRGALAALPAASEVLLCGDDPTVASLGDDVRAGVFYYGLDDDSLGDDHLPHAADAKFCPRCGEPLVFDRVYVGHLGRYRCPNGHFARPPLDFAADRVEFDGLRAQRLHVAGDDDATTVAVPLSGLYNSYNVLAAAAAAERLRVARAEVVRAAAVFRPAFGRLEEVLVEGRSLRLMLAKNPASFNEVLRAATTLGDGKRFLVAVNDRIADGRDVSWIWDVDFERLNDASWIVLGGTRALDMSVRLKYGGRRSAGVEVAEAPGAALDRCLALAAPGDEVFVLPTYTAMLDLRAELVRRGYAHPYWEDA